MWILDVTVYDTALWLAVCFVCPQKIDLNLNNYDTCTLLFKYNSKYGSVRHTASSLFIVSSVLCPVDSP